MTVPFAMRPCALLRRAKIDDYREQYANNQNISFLPAITSTSTRMHGEFLRHLLLQAHRESTAHFTVRTELRLLIDRP